MFFFSYKKIKNKPSEISSLSSQLPHVKPKYACKHFLVYMQIIYLHLTVYLLALDHCHQVLL